MQEAGDLARLLLEIAKRDNYKVKSLFDQIKPETFDDYSVLMNFLSVLVDANFIDVLPWLHESFGEEQYALGLCAMGAPPALLRVLVPRCLAELARLCHDRQEHTRVPELLRSVEVDAELVRHAIDEAKKNGAVVGEQLLLACINKPPTDPEQAKYVLKGVHIPSTCTLTENSGAWDAGVVIFGRELSLLPRWTCRAWKDALLHIGHDMPMNTLDDEKLFSDMDLFMNAVNGPVLCEGGCPMFICNCSNEVSEDNDEVTYIPTVATPWYTGTCFTCGRDIKGKSSAVREPLPDGCWYGCYCEPTCIPSESDNTARMILGAKAWLALGIFENN